MNRKYGCMSGEVASSCAPSSLTISLIGMCLILSSLMVPGLHFTLPTQFVPAFLRPRSAVSSVGLTLITHRSASVLHGVSDAPRRARVNNVAPALKHGDLGVLSNSALAALVIKQNDEASLRFIERHSDFRTALAEGLNDLGGLRPCSASETASAGPARGSEPAGCLP